MENIDYRHQRVILSFSKHPAGMKEQEKHMSDQALLQQYRRTGQNRWLGLLFERYTLLVFGVCMKYMKHEEDARDCTQQTFEKAIQELEKYEITFLKSWLYRVATNICLMKLRSKGIDTANLTDQLSETTGDEAMADMAIEKETLLRNMEQAIQLLNHEQRNCITLFYLNGLSYQQISDSTGYSVLQVKSHIQNGKRNLKLRMQQMKHHE